MPILAHKGDTMELLPKQVDEVYTYQTRSFTTATEDEERTRREQTGDGSGISVRDKPTPTRYPAGMLFRTSDELLYAFLVALQLIPIILLAVYAPKLSKSLSITGCLPSGNFRMPGRATVWDIDLLLEITIPTSHNVGRDHSAILDLGRGLSYTTVKVIDIIWDVIIARGGQAILAYIAYHVFHKSLNYLLESRPISFATYGAVAFDTGRFASLHRLIRAPFSQKIPSGALGLRTYVAMALASGYIVAMPILFSAMTGYAAITTPALMVPNYASDSPHTVPGTDLPGSNSDYCMSDGAVCDIVQCINGGFQPGFAWNADYGKRNVTWAVGMKAAIAAYPDAETVDDSFVYGDDRAFTAYYRQWEDSYKKATSDPACGNWSSPACEALQHPSQIPWHEETGTQHPADQAPLGTVDLDPPLLNLQRWYADANGYPTVWLCNDLVINTQDFEGGRNITGTCSAGNGYQWGFSFLLLFITCVLNLVFALLMYGLWFEADRFSKTLRREYRKGDRRARWVDADRPSLAYDAVRIVGEMESHCGEQIKGWTSRELDAVVWRGSKGMRAWRSPIDRTID